ncbi:MAG: eCIS core domain-containing protein [Thermomicrobiales bacterium]
MNASTERQPTLGERLTRQVEGMQRRRTPHRAWQGLVETILARDDERRATHADRWQRREPPAGSIVPAPPDDAPTDSEPAAPPRRPEPLVREVLGEWAPVIRIHDDAPAAAFAARHRADAVTVGTEIFLGAPTRQAPEFREQVIAHELTHVAQALDPHAAWQRMTATGIDREERRAVAAERTVGERTAPQTARSPFLPAPMPTPGPAPSPAAPIASPSSPVMRPMPADVGRDVTPEQPVAPIVTSPLTNDQVMQALMLKIRTDYERGG